MRPQAIKSESMQYPGHEGAMIDAYFSRPEAPGNYPGVIVTPEAFGLVEHIKDVARRFAAQGYLAIAPELYTREGAPDPDNMDQVIQKMFASPDTRAVGDLDAAARFLKGQAHCNGKVGIIGFCSGGRYTLITACKSSNIDAAVDSAGGFIIQDEHTESRPVSPIDMIPTLSCPPSGHLRRGRPQPVSGPCRANARGTGQAQQDLRVPDVPQRRARILCRLPPQLSSGGRPGLWHRVMVFYDKHLR